ncbi:hypothetical protein NECAME_17068 [Necator americanus]|uniref:Protein kinase domain-containing protein n=1 Tax=Necator americanus TaxID=51031 RepID=W2TS40_NECAM|nr:hypothetical protein NECAME_17068 [Necator americanus]ETN84643.1 hypothetical protein NECAME_17068 [Necator americanus]
MSSEEDDEILPKDGEELKTWKDKYTVVKLLGKGGYGAVYKVVRKSDNKPFAVKCEKLSARKKIGRNLWDLRVERESMRFTLNTSLKAAEQCLICIEELHRLGFLHRDIKPGNFATGRPDANEHHIIYMLDFGLCRKFQEKDKDVRVPREVAPFRGTTRYAPIAAMKQIEQSRKEDLEGWMYMVVEWTSGGLPWRKYKADNREEVLKMKEEVRDKEDAMTIFLKNCPEREFKRIMKYLYELTYFSIPDYNFIYYCIQHACKSNNIKPTDPLDWDMDHEFSGPTGPPGKGKSDMKLDEHDEDFDGGKIIKVCRVDKTGYLPFAFSRSEKVADDEICLLNYERKPFGIMGGTTMETIL